METKAKKAGVGGTMAIALSLFLALGFGPAWAGTIVVDGIKVTYPYGFDAYYDASDNTLTIVILDEGGNLNVKALPWASIYWGSYVDVYLFADCAYVPSVSFKGRWDLYFYITGQVGELYKLSINNGFVGGTDFYGTQGLGRGYPPVPQSINIKKGCAFGSVLGEAFFACPGSY